MPTVQVAAPAPSASTAAGGAGEEVTTAAASVAVGRVPRQSDVVPGAVMEARLIQWHMANIEFANAARLGNLSMKVRMVGGGCWGHRKCANPGQ
jgi:hypothetical protein